MNSYNKTNDEEFAIRLSTLTAQRDSLRSELETLFEQMQEVKSKMSFVQDNLHVLDEEIDALELKKINGNGGGGTGKNIMFATQLSQKDDDDNNGGRRRRSGAVVSVKEEGLFEVTEDDVEEEKEDDTNNNTVDCVSLPLKKRRKGAAKMQQDNKENTNDDDGDNHKWDHEEILTDPMTCATQRSPQRHRNGGGGGLQLTEQISEDEEEEAFHNPAAGTGGNSSGSAMSGVPPRLQIVQGGTTTVNNPYANFTSSSGSEHRGINNAGSLTNATMTGLAGANAVSDDNVARGLQRTHQGKITYADLPQGLISSSNTSTMGPLDAFVTRSGGQQPSSCSAAASANNQNVIRSMPSSSSSLQQVNSTFTQDFKSDNFPWSQQMATYLKNTFHIASFRDHQKEIINSTLAGQDAFVIMRTGGGKSLTYQLPALLEGRGRHRKITLVVSPLLSLIQDQEDQMNAFYQGSALSFTSNAGSKNTKNDHASKWALVRNDESGVCLIFVTPERIHKSNKLKNELEKLYAKNRLGRFVIDECHCATQWGHDFRPDYTKLGLLKKHFPSVPLLAVTATASDKVREDCCRILHLGANCKLYRSSANRLNLRYSVRIKPDNKHKVVEEMAYYIKGNYPNDAGIIYTFSKKEADEIAKELNDLGVTAKSYHGSVAPSVKENVHRRWMTNQIQVVVATIAFGLGINKPDVRFVLHHSISKTLESYYQESGRAGRDGKPADCILWYSTKDVARMLCMIHGEVGESSFWSMVRYAQENGDDEVCRKIILRVLGEADESEELDRSGCVGEERDVTVHAKTVIRLVQHVVQRGDDVTQPKLVAAWRSKKEDVPDCVKQNPPGKDINKDECDRIIIAMMTNDLLEPKVTWANPYTSCMYIIPGRNARRWLDSSTAKLKVRLIPRKNRPSTSTTKSKNTSSAESPPPAKASGDGWISTKKKKKSKLSTSGNSARKKKRKATNTSGRMKLSSKTISSSSLRNSIGGGDSEIIELDCSSSDHNNDDDDDYNGKQRSISQNDTLKKRSRVKETVDIFVDSSSSDNDSEFEFA